MKIMYVAPRVSEFEVNVADILAASDGGPSFGRRTVEQDNDANAFSKNTDWEEDE